MQSCLVLTTVNNSVKILTNDNSEISMRIISIMTWENIVFELKKATNERYIDLPLSGTRDNLIEKEYMRRFLLMKCHTFLTIIATIL